MKIKYEFATETVEVEVSAEMYALHMELNRVEYNNNHRETRRHVSLDTGLEHSEWLRSYDSDVYQQIAAEEDAANIRAAIDALSDSQKDLIQKIFDEGMSIKDYAEVCGCFLQVQIPEICRQKWRILHLRFGESCRLPGRIA